jgi:hypothetical protein
MFSAAGRSRIALYAGTPRLGAFFHHHHADHRPHLHLVAAPAHDAPQSGESGNTAGEAFTALPHRHNHHHHHRHEVSDRRAAHEKGHWHFALPEAGEAAAPRVPYLLEIVALAPVVVSDGRGEIASDFRLVIVHPARPPP